MEIKVENGGDDDERMELKENGWINVSCLTNSARLILGLLSLIAVLVGLTHTRPNHTVFRVLHTTKFELIPISGPYIESKFAYIHTCRSPGGRD